MYFSGDFTMENRAIAERLLSYALHLNEHDPNLFRRRAYRRAAEILMRLDRPIASILAENGRKGLEALPGIGRHLSYTIEGLVRSGEFRTLTRGERPVHFKLVVTEN